jgi:hypothetical protein
VPSLAKRAEFKNVPGIVTPVADMKILQKTNKGWKVAGFHFYRIVQQHLEDAKDHSIHAANTTRRRLK